MVPPFHPGAGGITAAPILPFGPRRKVRFRVISTALPPLRGVARISHVVPGSRMLDSVTVALTDPGCDQSYRFRSQKRPTIQVPSVTSAKPSPLSWTDLFAAQPHDNEDDRRSAAVRRTGQSTKAARVSLT